MQGSKLRYGGHAARTITNKFELEPLSLRTTIWRKLIKFSLITNHKQPTSPKNNILIYKDRNIKNKEKLNLNLEEQENTKKEIQST